MSATAALRPTEITARTLQNRALENRALENRALENRALENRFFKHHLTSKYFGLADRLWLAEIEDAAALLDLEDRLC